MARKLAERAIQIIRERYSDFGPTLACEKLAELHGVMLSKETVRKLMMHRAGIVRQKSSNLASAVRALVN